MNKNKIRVVVILSVLLILIIVLSVFAILILSEVNGKNRKEETVLLEVTSGMTTKQIASQLHMKGVIRFPSLLQFQAVKEGIDTKLQKGTYEIHIGESYRQILYVLKQTPNYRPSVRITFKEGIEVSQIIQQFLDNGIGTKQGFQEAITYDYGYDYLPNYDQIAKKSDQLVPDYNVPQEVRLEGYLYPDTYDFYLDDTEINVFAKMIANFDSKLKSAGIASLAEANGLSLNEAVTLGSIIQREAGKVSDFRLISSVFNNRLKDGWKLQSDAVVSYPIPKSERLVSCTAEQLKTDSPWNVYIHEKLPVSAICCPSIDAIVAACTPESSSYFYFIGVPDGSTVFAETYAQHQQNIKKYLK